MNNFSMAQEATATAIGSTGSAMREQEKYADSLEARINRLDTAWNNLVITTGNAFLTDGLISSIEALNDLASVTAVAIDKLGFLPIVFGTIGATVTLLSTKVRAFSTALVFGTTEMTRAQLASAGLSAGMSRLGIATMGATAAFRGLIASTGIGLAFVAIGFAIEKLISAYSNAKQAQEDFEATQQKNIVALTTNKEKTEELIDSYKKLTQEKENGQWNNEKEREYLQIQQQLGDAFPTLIDHLDHTGQAHLKNADQIDKEIEATEKLLELKREEIRLNAQSTFEDNIDERDGFFGLEKEIERKRKQIEEADGVVKPEIVNKMKQELLSMENQLSQSSMRINDQVLKVADAYNELKIDPSINKSVREFVSSLDLTDLDASELDKFSQEIAKYTDNLQKATEAGNQEGFNKAKQDISDLAKGMDITGTNGTALNLTFKQVQDAIEIVANATYDGSEGMDDLAESTEDATNAQEDLLSISEKIVGASKKQIDSAKEQIAAYRLLTSIEDKSEEQTNMLSDAVKSLGDMYPHLIDGTGLRIDAMEKEAEQSEILLKALEQMQDGQLSIEEEMTVTAILNAKSRMSLLLEQARAYEAFANRLAKEADALANTGNQRAAEDAEIRARKIQGKANDAYSDFSRELEALMPDMDKWTSQLAEATDYSGKNYTSTKSLNEEMKDATYQTDKYAQALGELNLELEKQNKLQAKLPTYSQEYQKSLKNEMSLLKQKKKLLEDQSKTLESQIATGNFTTASSPTTSTVSTGGGSSNQIWSFFKSKGFTDEIVAGIMGNLQMESNLNPNALNKSSGAFGIAQWLGSRKTALQNYANSVGKSVSDISTQLEFLWKELNSTEKRTLNWLNSNLDASASKVAEMFDKLFERSEGTHIPQRQNYANQFLKQFAGSSAVNSVASSVAKYYLDGIDNAESDLAQLQSELISINDQIAQANYELLRYPIAVYEKRIRDQEKNIINTTNSLYSLTQGTSEYGFALRQLVAYQQEKQVQNEKEINFMRQLIGSGKLSAQQVAEVSEELQTLLERRYEIAEARDDIQAQIVTNALYNYSKAIEDVNYKLEMSQALQESYVEGSQEYNDEMITQAELIKQKRDLLTDEITKLEELIKKQDLSIESTNEFKSQLRELKLELQGVTNELNQMVVSELSKLRDIELEGINKHYDALIEKQQERLDLLDEEIEKEDRLKELRELNDEINKVKDDKRFSFITEEGEEILTYDTARVAELEKERDELLKQYEREDIKKSIQDEIERLEKAKEDTIKTEEEKWKGLLEAAQSGTLTFEEFMSTWYTSSSESLGNYVGDVEQKINKLKELFEALKTLKAESSNPLGMSESDFNRYVNNKKLYESGASGSTQAAKENQSLREKYEIPSDSYSYDDLKKFHSGGVVGGSNNRLTELANKLFNAKPNEQVIKALKGEIFTTPQNLAKNFLPSLKGLVNSVHSQSSVAQSGDTIHLNNVTVVANNPNEFMSQLKSQLQIYKKNIHM